jgi:hypothetical protein
VAISEIIFCNQLISEKCGAGSIQRSSMIDNEGYLIAGTNAAARRLARELSASLSDSVSVASQFPACRIHPGNSLSDHAETGQKIFRL